MVNPNQAQVLQWIPYLFIGICQGYCMTCTVSRPRHAIHRISARYRGHGVEILPGTKFNALLLYVIFRIFVPSRTNQDMPIPCAYIIILLTPQGGRGRRPWPSVLSIGCWHILVWPRRPKYWNKSQYKDNTKFGTTRCKRDRCMG